MEDYNVYKEIYRSEDHCLCQTVSMNECGAFEIRCKFKEEYGGGEHWAYVSSVAVKAMMKALERLYERKTN